MADKPNTPIPAKALASTPGERGIAANRTRRGLHAVKPQSWWINGRGYVEGKIWTAQGQRRVKQHRFVMECAIGRRLCPHEDVHHINGVKTDNRIENLEVMTHGEHSTLTGKARDYSTRRPMTLTDAERARRADHMRAIGKKYGPINSPFAKARGES